MRGRIAAHLTFCNTNWTRAAASGATPSPLARRAEAHNAEDAREFYSVYERQRADVPISDLVDLSMIRWLAGEYREGLRLALEVRARMFEQERYPIRWLKVAASSSDTQETQRTTGRSNAGLKNRLARAAKMIGVKPTTAP